MSKYVGHTTGPMVEHEIAASYLLPAPGGEVVRDYIAQRETLRQENARIRGVLAELAVAYRCVAGLDGAYDEAVRKAEVVLDELEGGARSAEQRTGEARP